MHRVRFESRFFLPAVATAAALLVVALLGVPGCQPRSLKPGATSEASATAPPTQPLLRTDQQRVDLDGLLVTLTATSTLPPDLRRGMYSSAELSLKNGNRPLYIEVEATNSTDATIGGATTKVEVVGSNGKPAEHLVEVVGIGGKGNGAPYFGMGGPPPGRPRSSDYGPGSSLRVESPRQVPRGMHDFTVTWRAADGRVATFKVSI